MKIKYLLISLLLASAAYGSFVLVRQLTLLKQSCIKVVGHKFSTISLNYAKLILTLQVKNNSDIDLAVKGDNFNVYINDVYASSIKTTHNANLPAHSSANMELAIEFDPKKVLKGIGASFTAMSTDVKIQLKGRLTVISNAIIVNNLKINETFTLAEILAPSAPNSNC